MARGLIVYCFEHVLSLNTFFGPSQIHFILIYRAKISSLIISGYKRVPGSFWLSSAGLVHFVGSRSSDHVFLALCISTFFNFFTQSLSVCVYL